jgi:uncharacterized protein (TIGR03546 family)
MIITRKFGKIFRGKATTPQLVMAALIGTMAGFMPGFTQAPGILVVLFLAAVILNANLALVGLCLLLGKILSFALLPVSFAVGRLLLEGPAESFFAAMVNAPVLALFGFEYYATTGGLVVGAFIGAGIAFGTVRAVRAFRWKMAQMEKGSEKWKKFSARPEIKVFTFIFIGGDRGKTSYEELLNRKGGGSPIRPAGIVFAALVMVSGFFFSLLASDEIVTFLVRTGLEEANGATVDLEKAELRLSEGRLTLTGLALADPRNLDTDLFRAGLIEADVSKADLLRKRIHIENLQATAASSGAKRERSGYLVRPHPDLPLPPKTGRTFEDYVREAEKWKERLAQVADWMDRMSGGAEEDAQTEEERERQIRAAGYRNAVASHLIQGAPTVLVSRMAVEQMRVAHFPDETLDIVGENFSTHPHLVEKAPQFTIRSSGQTFLVDASLASVSRSRGLNTMEFVYLNLPADKVAGGLRFQDKAPMQGGSIDVRGSGSWTRGEINLPLEVTLRESRLALARVGETHIDRLVLPIGVDGPLRNPRVHFTDSSVVDALTAAGKAELARRVQGETDKLRSQAEERVGEEVRERTRGLLDNRLPLPLQRQ